MSGLYFNQGRDYQKNVEKAWELFNSDIEIKEPKVSKVILESWNRSRQFRVNTELNQAPDVIETCRLNSERDIYSALRKAALPVIKDARNVLDDNQLLMLLTSAEGTILEREGNSKSLMMADTQQLVVGSNWSEERCGTNAVGTAISLQRPVQVIAREHYCDMTQVWGCAAVPIRDLRDGRTLGILDTTGPEHSFLSMNLGWVNSMASCIELRLNEAQSKSKYRLIEDCMGQIRRWHKEKIMVFDKEGFLIWISREALPKQKEFPGFLQDISVGTRQDGMSMDQLNHDIPAGISREWLEPVIVDGEIAGHFLIIPSSNKAKKQHPVIPIEDSVEAKSTLLVGVSDKVVQLRKLAKKLASFNTIVTITGETGTGKEVFAKEIHSMSGKTGEFVAINCGAIQKELLASELFGYAEGSFSGAKRGGMIGKFESAQHGTILLDEFCELPLDLQVYLLRVLEEREVVRIGESKVRPVNARIIVATNKDLEKEMAEGRLREDLYYRVNASVLELPPLREHKEDVAVLFQYFMEKVSVESCSAAPKPSDVFTRALQQYNWPGNIRELRNFAENCFLMNAGEELTLDHLPKRMSKVVTSINPSDSTLEGLERAAIKEALTLYAGNISKAASHLGIARSTFYKKIEKYQLLIN
ncbi:MAG: sigma-54-dependent Fis family transcriptional regulator [Cycloclasticus sp.]|nr:sigma-54-dependent Fis family transcriptional regulator [Cycloclasticus sp.]